ncbi:hypothetical protein HQ545_02575 [Candidatus Woesearchaeota archaeon]|nr:hypothetical protein [Candidatus Woesearchaeota archaeon]
MVSKKNNDIWKYISHLQKLGDIYQKDFEKDNKKISEKLNSIKLHLNRKKESKLDITSLNTFCIEEWKKAIELAIKSLIETVDKRKTRGSEFSDIKFQLNKLKEDIQIEEFEMDKYENMYENDLKGFKEQIKEKMDIEKFNNKRFWWGLAIGATLGIIGTILLGVFV